VLEPSALSPDFLKEIFRLGFCRDKACLVSTFYSILQPDSKGKSNPKTPKISGFGLNTIQRPKGFNGDASNV